jgi:hypothetical protein
MSEARWREFELYRLFDVLTSPFHSDQTHGMMAGTLAIVSQGHGVLSLMIVGGRTPDRGDEQEDTFLSRGAGGTGMGYTADDFIAPTIMTSERLALGVDLSCGVSLVDGHVRLPRVAYAAEAVAALPRLLLRTHTAI